MFNEGKRLEIGKTNLKGGLILDEMSIQDDLQIIKRQNSWQIVGAIDMGELVNSLEYVWTKKKEIDLATHCLQFLYCGYGGFCWPVAFYGSKNASAHQIYFTFWNLCKELFEYGFEVEYGMLDGSVMNRNFTNLLFPSDPRKFNFCAVNPFNASQRIPIVQDIKHCIKKIRNSLLSSRSNSASKRCMMHDGKMIIWEHFERTYDFNNTYKLRPQWKITRNHIYPSQTDKMRNHLAEEVLNEDFVDLMQKYQQSLSEPSELDSTLKLLRNTAVLIDIFNNAHSPVENLRDIRINQLSNVLDFFISWEKEFEGHEKKDKFLMTKETRDDVVSTITGFFEVIKRADKSGISIIPGYFNSDLIENWFCQLRRLRQGMNTNMTLSQIGSSNNANILTGNLVATKSKSNVGKGVRLFTGAHPAPKKLKK